MVSPEAPDGPDASTPPAPVPRRGSIALGIGSALLFFALIAGIEAIGKCNSEYEGSVLDCIVAVFWLVVLGLPGLITVLVGLARRYSQP